LNGVRALGLAAGLLAGAALGAAPKPLLDIPTPYLPSTTVAVDEMLRLGGVGPDDLVVDLGSGDGRIVIAAARDYGARGLGIELDPKLVAESQVNAQQAGVADRVSFRQGDALAADIREATVVTLYLLPVLVEKLKPRLLAELRPGTRIVAHDYGFQERVRSGPAVPGDTWRRARGRRLPPGVRRPARRRPHRLRAGG
jgi:ribosomal protein L11 methylase PrmA